MVGLLLPTMQALKHNLYHLRSPQNSFWFSIPLVVVAQRGCCHSMPLQCNLAGCRRLVLLLSQFSFASIILMSSAVSCVS